MYTVVGKMASRTFRVLWTLEEIGQAYSHKPLAPRDPALSAYTSSGKIPVLLDGDETLTDSVAIMTYLADKHGTLTAPSGTAARARQDAITLWVIDEFDAALWMAAKHRAILPEHKRVSNILPALKEDFAAKVDLFADKIVGEFVMGDQLTIADILAVHCLNWAVGAQFPVENDRVKAYAKRLRARDAFRSVRALE